MTDEPQSGSDQGTVITRLTLLKRAGVAAAAAGLAGCGVDETRRTVSPDVNAAQFPPLPPSQPPLNCHVYAFLTRDEAQTVDAITSRACAKSRVNSSVPIPSSRE